MSLEMLDGEIQTIIPNNEELVENSGSNVYEVEKSKNLKNLLTEDDYSDIDREMNKFNISRQIKDEWGIAEEEYARRSDHNESKYLLEGTLELIQDIVDKASTSEPFDTIIFLDKSARPSSYLYYRMVKVLSEKGYIPEDLKMPQIKYMDIGKSTEGNKISSPNTESILREKLKKDQLGKRVLIVDEFKLSGSTLTKALGDFPRIYGKDIEVTGLYQFRNPGLAPFWYYDRDRHIGSLFRNRTLVSDAQNTEKTRKLDSAYTYSENGGIEPKMGGKGLEELGTNTEEIEMFKKLANTLSKDLFNDLFLYAYDNQNLDQESKYKDVKEIISKSASRVDFESVKNEIDKVLTTKLRVLPTSLYDYFRYAGGWFAAPDKSSRDSGIKLRNMFDKLIGLASERL